MNNPRKRSVYGQRRFSVPWSHSRQTGEAPVEHPPLQHPALLPPVPHGVEPSSQSRLLVTAAGSHQDGAYIPVLRDLLHFYADSPVDHARSVQMCRVVGTLPVPERVVYVRKGDLPPLVQWLIGERGTTSH